MLTIMTLLACGALSNPSFESIDFEIEPGPDLIVTDPEGVRRNISQEAPSLGTPWVFYLVPCPRDMLIDSLGPPDSFSEGLRHISWELPNPTREVSVVPSDQGLSACDLTVRTKAPK